MPSAKYVFADKKDLYIASAKRDAYSTKRENGRVVIVGGCEYFHGAPALASTAAYSLLAALRVGTGYAVAFVPRGILNPNRKVSPDIIVRPLSGNSLNLNDISMLKKAIDSSDCLVIGSGLGRKAQTLRAASKLISYADKTGKMVVVDADAIYAVAKYKTSLSRNAILTPNEKEFALVYKKKLDRKDIGARINAASYVAKRLKTNILLKGHDTVVTDGKRVKVVRSKSSALATMGTGDVLSGIIGAYASFGNDVFIAGVAGAYLHSTIGDALYKEKGNHILASDIVDRIPKVLRHFGKSL